MTDDDGTAAPPASAEPQFCYRHPSAETYVHCVRCDRPICPNCMQTASVGFQCPECVRGGRASVRRPRTVFGGMVPAKAGVVTRALIAINVVVFIIQQAASDRFTVRFEMIPLGIPHTFAAGVAHGQYYRMITSAFLHANVLHIFLNMYALLLIGPTLEAALGRLRFIVLYFVSALGGSVGAYLLMPSNGAAVGASGAIFGLFGALFVVTRRMGSETGGILALILINLVFSFTFAGIAWQAHLGGLITGTVLAVAFAYAPRQQQALVQWSAVGVVLLILVALTAARTHTLTQPSTGRAASMAATTSAGSAPSR
jgi:membrane associated rhomboid family serine protease